MRRIETLIEPLTPRELEILALLAKHLTNKEIAASLSLSVNSVKWYARQIYGKLGVENRRQVTARASELGLLPTVTIEGESPFLATGSDISNRSYPVSKPRHNLPLQLTSFVGRSMEIERVKKLLLISRLVTLTGAGGVGKTRLALAVASQMLDEFKDGIWLVELAPLGDPEIIPETIAAVFEVRSDQNRSLRTALLDYLREKQLLLILDNCEHLIEACAELADTILRESPQVVILGSSRESLGIEGETPFYVPSLPFPKMVNLSPSESLQDYEAVQLFLERARLILPEFAVTETNALSLAKICQRLDGIPLALELAAARLQVLSLEQIAARLDDRFRLLTGGSRRTLPRHQTLYALIDWSYDLLTEAERTFFRRLSVFAGRWTLETAEAVCTEESPATSTSTKSNGLGLTSAEIIDLLGGLVNKSLIIVERIGDEIRGYRMLETVRQYAQEKLVEAGEAEKFRDRHLDFFLGLAEESEPLLRGPEVKNRLELLDDEVGNLRLALSWALGGECGDRIAKGLSLGSALHFYWNSRGSIDEGINYLQKGLEILSGEEKQWEKQRAKALFAAGDLILHTWDFGRFDEARVLLEDSLALYQKNQDQVGVALAQCALGQSLMEKYVFTFSNNIDRVEYPTAHSLAEQGLATIRRLGKPSDLVFALTMNFYIYSEGMDFSTAQAFGEEGLILGEALGDLTILGSILRQLGSLALNQGNLISAKRYFDKALALAQELKDKGGILGAYIGLVVVAYYNRDYETQERLIRSCMELNQEIGAVIIRLTCYRVLARVMLHEGKLTIAREYLLKYLSLAMKSIGYEYDLRLFLSVMARLALELGLLVTAARLLGAVEAQFEGFFKPLDLWDQEEFDLTASEIHHQLDEITFASAWAAGRKLTLEQAIAEAQNITP
jgi:predicted ATPase/DNA-binding CsgD family transcriptional regulator